MRHGKLIGRELCESEEQALLAVRAWTEYDGVECEVADLSTRWHDGDGDGGTELLDRGQDDYPEESEFERSAGDSMRFPD